MDRYPKPIDPTRGTLPRRLADIAASAGAGGVLALLVGNAQVDQFAGLLSLGLLTIGAGYKSSMKCGSYGSIPELGPLIDGIYCDKTSTDVGRASSSSTPQRLPTHLVILTNPTFSGGR